MKVRFFFFFFLVLPTSLLGLVRAVSIHPNMAPRIWGRQGHSDIVLKKLKILSWSETP